MQKNLARRDNAVKQMTENDPELKNGVRVKLARIMDDIISRLEALTLNWLKMRNSNGNGYLSQKPMDKKDQKPNIR